MTAKLLRCTPIIAVVEAIRMCKSSQDGSDTSAEYHDLSVRDYNLVIRCINSGHTSVLEHCVFTFAIRLSRACLQEFSRTRIAVESVQSSRFTLGKLLRKEDHDNLHDLFYHTGNEFVDMASLSAMQTLRELVQGGIPNDLAKYAIPESMLTQLIFTINARSLRNLFNTRLNKDVLLEYRNLAWDMYDAIPSSHHVLFEDIIKDKPERPQ
jgi:thymidylate synthase (FAD)